MKEQNVVVTGLVATTPRHLVTTDGLPITSFRLASAVKKWDSDKGDWADAETNWFTVTSFKALAVNTAMSVSKGDRVIVAGVLRVRDWDNGERAYLLGQQYQARLIRTERLGIGEHNGSPILA